MGRGQRRARRRRRFHPGGHPLGAGMTARRPIPVTVIGGYLGAGKTTCLNHLLASDHGLRLAVLVNDFGAVNIDAGLIAEHGGDTVALTNGCVCCAIADDLGAALQAQTDRDSPPDRIVVEASGVADPARVMRLAGNWPGCRPAGTAVLADAATVREWARDKFVGRLVVQQMQAADLLVLNKLDLLAAPEAGQVRAWVQAQAAPADLVEARFAQVDPVRLLGMGGTLPAPSAGDAGEPEGPGHGLSSAVWRPAGPVDPGALERLLAGWPDIHRAKGVVTTGAGPRRIDWSGGRLDLSPAPPDRPQLVLIGPFGAAARKALLRALDACAEPAGCAGRFAG
ncbi:MAG: GTP-binding protein [Rhodospirillaceae bacterium]|nr:GTP-binding protein [Rhodospirillaceae bacterium]